MPKQEIEQMIRKYTLEACEGRLITFKKGMNTYVGVLNCIGGGNWAMIMGFQAYGEQGEIKIPFTQEQVRYQAWDEGHNRPYIEVLPW
jgi:hypothetical protein